MRTNYKPLNKEQLDKILDTIEEQYPTIETMYQDLEKFYEDVENTIEEFRGDKAGVIVDKVGTDVDYLTWEPDNDTYRADDAIDDVMRYIFESEKNGRHINEWVCRWIDDMLLLLISYK